MNSEIQIQLAELKAAQDHLEQAVRQTVELLSDTSLDFEERQQAYFKIEKYLPCHSWIYHFKTCSDISSYVGGPVWVERHQTIDFSYVAECIEETFYEYYDEETGVLAEFSSDDKDFFKDFLSRGYDILNKNPEEVSAEEAFQANLKAFFQEIMESGYGSYTHDW